MREKEYTYRVLHRRFFYQRGFEKKLACIEEYVGKKLWFLFRILKVPKISCETQPIKNFSRMQPKYISNID